MLDNYSNIEGDYGIVVLIPHYNNLNGLKKSIQSIVYDKNFLILIIDDGSVSTQKPNESDFILLDHISIKVLNNTKNEGIEFSLNKGLKFIISHQLSKYIARLDCGDIMINNRLERQVRYLEVNKDVDLVGSWVKFVQNDKDLFTVRLPTNHSRIYRKMMVKVCFIHPAVMFRTSALNKVGLYPNDFPAAEDYAFFMKFVKQLKTSNIPEVLTIVENNPNGISISKRKVQLKSRLKVIKKYTTSKLYFIFGVLKIWLLILIPFKLVNWIKTIVFK